MYLDSERSRRKGTERYLGHSREAAGRGDFRRLPSVLVLGETGMGKADF